MSWWREAVFYHVYVRSFKDADGDGVGDLRGVLERIDYFMELGVNAVWLSPFYPSPQADHGYDITDHRAVDPRWGDMATLEAIRDTLHRRGMRLIFDLIPNHTSSEHPWFKAALGDREAPSRDLYIWRDSAPNGGPPNRWVSLFGGPAWTLDPTSGQHYLHSFLPQQPDLNWRAPALRRAVQGDIRFWLNWGVDGFRVDAVPHLLKDPGFRSNPLRPGVDPSAPDYDPYMAQEHLYDQMNPGIHDVVQALRCTTHKHPEAILVGEVTLSNLDTYAGFLTDGEEQLHLAFNYPMIQAHSFPEIRAAVEGAERALHPRAWPTLALSNHDASRHVTRLGVEDQPDAQKLAAAITLLARGAAFLYYGEELGLGDLKIPDEALQDPVGRFERDHQRRLGALPPRSGLGRDGARCPMPWTPEGGFSEAAPWLPSYDPTQINVEEARLDPDSVWWFYRDLLTLRRACPSLRRGRMTSEESPEGLWIFTRAWAGAELRVCLNLTDAPVYAPSCVGRVALGSRRDLGARLNGATLAPYEVVVLS